MGLAVTGYEKLGYLGTLDAGDAAEANLDEGFLDLRPQRGVPDRSDGLKPGWYMPIGKQHAVGNVSYSGYGAWRRMLAAMVGVDLKKLWKHHHAGPFVELLNYADNEGFFGPKTSTKLAADFKAYRPTAVAFAGAVGGKGFEWSGTDWLKLYNDYAKAFAVAAGSGVVYFH